MWHPIFVSCAKGLENLLMQELQILGLQNCKNNPHGVYGDATINTIYEIALWSRLANRLHLVLCQGPAKNSDILYQTCLAYAWPDVFSAQHSLRISFHGTSDELRNEMYAAQVVKDAVVDHFRQVSGERPQIDKHDAQVSLSAHLKHDQVTVSLDLVGYSLHQRGYRSEQGVAPLKENLAAALLMRMNWPEIALGGGGFTDLLCGSGTIVIEAAMMAANMAPGLLRDDQAFPYWSLHQPTLWAKHREQAREQIKAINNLFFGSDIHRHAIEIAKANGIRAGVDHLITWKQQPLNIAKKPYDTGLLVTNPPYGERLGEQLELLPLYGEFGETLFNEFQGWQAGIITSDPMLAKALGLRAHKQYAFFNGALPCQLYCINIDSTNQFKNSSTKNLSGPAQMLANRLEKNITHLKKWAEKKNIECYRVYDADLPEYAFAIDKYADHIVLQEYMPPKHIPDHVAATRRLDMMMVVPQVFGVSPKNIVMKQRKPQKEQQYQKNDDKKQMMVVREGEAKFYLNLHDYLDTGLFLDHRILRLEFSKLKGHTRFLNLFCYTATASIHAALNGAYTTNVDMSKTYLAWASENFKLNQLPSSKHQFIHSDVMAWLRQSKETYDVIYMDTPSFSNSKRMEGTLDIQRDHVGLIKLALKHLHPEGQLYFSTHLRGFKIDESIAEFANIYDMSRKTLDLDFKRDPKIHQCFLIEKFAAI